ncbi:hypothetical protein BJ875DRAFT_367344 [Amylocarpus encephaloides]|uniref:Uncharacterized protein n=1 Tax=Amylocarpus encephaloides TaxID=45428 RepID=A0A9P7YRU2_9HELO|nr:hypothetical protein BJ875DRAFT_367344 [Amylocarpus encephaloides]
MRYQNWDILIFPDQSKVPLQEFRTACQVIQDPETYTSQSNPHLLPTITSFVPALLAGSNFRISIHSWQNPEMSRYLQNLKKPTDNILFEARAFVDGRILGSKWFSQYGPWPTILDFGIELDKQGEFEKLKFPAFHKEVLSQNYWSAGDDLGRVKIVIAEGFARDNVSYGFERAKNLVSFSFQHAPLDVLEASGIAWPNAGMWKQVALVGPYHYQHFSPQETLEDSDTHSHSPRRGKQSTAPESIGVLFNPNQPVFPRQPTFDPFTEPGRASFRGWRQNNSTDESMPDYLSASNTGTNSSRNVTGLVQASIKENRRFESLQAPGAHEYIFDALMPAAPANTSHNEEQAPAELPTTYTSAAMPPPSHRVVAAAAAASKSLSSKREADQIIVIPEPETTIITPTLVQESAKPSATKGKQADSPSSVEVLVLSSDPASRKASQPFQASIHGANKRQRVVTPAASKVIDDEDEPRSSPSIRKTSNRIMGSQQNKDGDRRILGRLDNV